MTPHHAAPTLDREPAQSKIILAQSNQLTFTANSQHQYESAKGMSNEC